MSTIGLYERKLHLAVSELLDVVQSEPVSSVILFSVKSLHRTSFYSQIHPFVSLGSLGDSSCARGIRNPLGKCGIPFQRI